MIFDHRTYICKPQLLKAHIALYEKMGMAVQKKHLGEPLLWATTDVGDVNSYVHVWSYKDVADRAAKRAKLWADPEWNAYVATSNELGALVAQDNKILVSTKIMKEPHVV